MVTIKQLRDQIEQEITQQVDLDFFILQNKRLEGLLPLNLDTKPIKQKTIIDYTHK
jgi:hypothetical protein